MSKLVNILRHMSDDEVVIVRRRSSDGVVEQLEIKAVERLKRDRALDGWVIERMYLLPSTAHFTNLEADDWDAFRLRADADSEDM